MLSELLTHYEGNPPVSGGIPQFDQKCKTVILLLLLLLVWTSCWTNSWTASNFETPWCSCNIMAIVSNCIHYWLQTRMKIEHPVYDLVAHLYDIILYAMVPYVLEDISRWMMGSALTGVHVMMYVWCIVLPHDILGQGATDMYWNVTNTVEYVIIQPV